MISQHLSGHRPINLEAALVYSRGLGVDVEAFSPRIAEQIARISVIDEETGLRVFNSSASRPVFGTRIAPALAPAPGPSHPPSLDQALEVVAAQLNALSPLVADAGRSALANLASGQATPQATAAVLEALASATAKLPIASSAIAETPVKVKKHET